jgi:hypothetical protein
MAVSFCVHEDWTRACSRTVGNKVGPAQTESASGKTLMRSVASTQGQCALPEGLSRRESDKNCTPRPVPHPCVLCKGGIPRCSSPWALGLLRPYRMSGVPPTLSAMIYFTCNSVPAAEAPPKSCPSNKKNVRTWDMRKAREGPNRPKNETYKRQAETRRESGHRPASHSSAYSSLGGQCRLHKVRERNFRCCDLSPENMP